MNAPQQTKKPESNSQKTPANIAALAKAREVRTKESERRDALTPQQRFKEDLVSAANSAARLIDGQRGSMLGVVVRGLRDQKTESGTNLGPGLTQDQCMRALNHIIKSLERVRDAIEKKEQGEEGFSLD